MQHSRFITTQDYIAIYIELLKIHKLKPIRVDKKEGRFVSIKNWLDLCPERKLKSAPIFTLTVTEVNFAFHLQIIFNVVNFDFNNPFIGGSTILKT